MKFPGIVLLLPLWQSLPARGVWIEIRQPPCCGSSRKSLPARGVWIEIEEYRSRIDRAASHSPQGECGLKFRRSGGDRRQPVSLPARGVWIEIKLASAGSDPAKSLPARGVWIEMEFERMALENDFVTPRKGSVD